MSVEGEGTDGPARPNFCTRCGERLAPGSNYCSKCGQPLAPVPPTYYQPYQAPKALTPRDVAMGLGTYAALALVAWMAFNVVIAIWGTGLVFPAMDTGSATIYVIIPFIVPIVALTGGAFFIYYLALVAAIVASFVWMLWKSVGRVRDEAMFRYPAKGHSPLYLVATVFMAVLAFNTIYYLLLDGIGATPTTPSFGTQELWQLIYGFAEASVWEEVVSRVLLIGIPLLLVDSFLRSSDQNFKMKRTRRYFLGGGFELGRKEIVFLLFSSFMFGAAHLFNWDLFKVFPAAMAGLAFGYLYLKVGLYASIMLHFAIDFLSVPLSVFPDGDVMMVGLGLALLVWVAIGTLYIVLYVSKIAGWMIGRRIWPDVPMTRPAQTYGPSYSYAPYAYNPTNYRPPVQYAPPAPGAPPPVGASTNYGRPRDPTAFGYACRNCGHREALYKDGELTCTRCGTKN